MTYDIVGVTYNHDVRVVVTPPTYDIVTVLGDLRHRIMMHLETPESLDMVYTWYILGIYF